MYIDRNQLLAKIKPEDKVLDIGGWDNIFPRANVVIDLNSYETRQYRDHGFLPGDEKFTKDTWIQGDFCKEDIWLNFKDKEFDFVTCGHIFEDVRDPLFLAKQINRIAKRGYIEFPSRFRELSKADKKDLVNGYDHHRWIVDIIDGEIVCTPKLHWANFIDYIGDQRRHYLNYYQFHFIGVFWEDSFNYYERFPKGELLESINIMYFFDNYDYENAQFIYEIKDGLQKCKVPTGECLYVDKFNLPVEKTTVDIQNRYINQYRIIRSGIKF